MDSNQPIELRAHHVAAALRMIPLSREEASNILVSAGYISEKNSPFMDVYYDRLKTLFSNPDQEFLVTADKPDFICRSCMEHCDKSKREGCFLIGEERASFLKEKYRRMIGIFSEGIEKTMVDDRYVAGQYGLDIGKTYTANQLREIIDSFK